MNNKFKNDNQTFKDKHYADQSSNFIELSDIDDLPQDFDSQNYRLVLNNNLVLSGSNANYYNEDRSPILTDRSSSDEQESNQVKMNFENQAETALEVVDYENNNINDVMNEALNQDNNGEGTNKDKQNMSIEYFSDTLAVKQLETKATLRRMRTDVGSKDCAHSVNDETIMNNNLIDKQSVISSEAILTSFKPDSPIKKSKPFATLHHQRTLQVQQSTQNSKISLFQQDSNTSPSVNFRKPRKERQKKKVTFRDKVYQGSQIADIFFVEKIKYPSSRNDDEDSGTVSCSCIIF